MSDFREKYEGAESRFEEPTRSTPNADQAARRRGRPPGSKNKPSTGLVLGSAAELLRRSAGDGPHEERFVEEGEPRAIGSGVVEPLRAAEPITTDPDFGRMLRETGEFKRFGTGARSPMFIVQDVSPSEVAHEAEWMAGAPEVANELAKSAIARNQVDVIHITGAESAEVLGFAHGAFAYPERIRYGQGTCCKPWLARVAAAYRTYEEHLRAERIATREGMVVFASDFQFADYDPAMLAPFKAFCRQKRLVVVSAMFGEPDRAVAGQFSAPIPPVDLKRVPLGLFIRELTKTATQSISRQASLESLMAAAISGLLERSAP